MLEKAHTGAANSDLPHSVVQNVFRGFLQRCLEKESDLASCAWAENGGARKEGLDLPLVFFFFFFFFFKREQPSKTDWLLKHPQRTVSSES